MGIKSDEEFERRGRTAAFLMMVGAAALFVWFLVTL